MSTGSGSASPCDFSKWEFTNQIKFLREIIRRRNEAKEVVTLGALLRNKEESKVVKDVLRVLTYSNT